MIQHISIVLEQLALLLQAVYQGQDNKEGYQTKGVCGLIYWIRMKFCLPWQKGLRTSQFAIIYSKEFWYSLKNLGRLLFICLSRRCIDIGLGVWLGLGMGLGLVLGLGLGVGVSVRARVG